ncbi:hypothetical protein OAM67_00665 [bacterium]|nr:hypothetical protein [bacterium]
MLSVLGMLSNYVDANDFVSGFVQNFFQSVDVVTRKYVIDAVVKTLAPVRYAPARRCGPVVVRYISTLASHQASPMQTVPASSRLSPKDAGSLEFWLEGCLEREENG